MAISIADTCWVVGCRNGATHFVFGRKSGGNIIACAVHADLMTKPILAPIPLKHNLPAFPQGCACKANCILETRLTISQGGELARRRLEHTVALGEDE